MKMKNSTNSTSSSKKFSSTLLAAGIIFTACIVMAIMVIAMNMKKAEEGLSMAEVEESMEAAKIEQILADTVKDSTEKVKTAEKADSKTSPSADSLSERWHFYNTELQANDDSLDDWNFGPNPMADVVVSSEAIAKAIKSGNTTVNVSDILAGVSAQDLDKNFRERLRKDAVLGAADMAWFDSILGTDYLGWFYSECNEKWDATMNKAAKAWLQDEADYDATLDSFEDYLNRATKVEIRHVTSGLTDQMYMNPATKSGIPKIIVMETLNHDGWFLVYTFTIKNTTTKEVMYRIDCGFQPTNVAEIMQVKVKSNKAAKKAVKKTTGGSGGNPGGNPSGNPGGGGNVSNKTTPTPTPKPTPKPTPTPTPTPTPIPKPDPVPKPPYDKDPTDGTPVLPNDDPDPGEDTNNGVGAEYSTKDLPDSSNHLTPEEYEQAIQELEDANATTREGGDSNVPSTPPPDANTVIDSNAENGTGNGGIDQPTSVQDSSVSSDQAGVHWDGPPL